MKDPMQLLSAHPVRKSGKHKTAFREEVRTLAEEYGYSYREEKVSFGGHNVVLGDPEKARFLVTAHYDTCASMLIPNLITPCNALPFLLYQLVVTVYMAILPVAVGLAARFLTGSQELSFWIGYITFWICLGMMMFGPANKTNANDNSSGVLTVLEIMRSLPVPQRDQVCFVLFDLEEAGLIGSSAYRKAHKAATDGQLVLNLDCVGDGDYLMLFPTKKLKKQKDKLDRLRKLTGPVGGKVLTLREKGFSVYPSDQRSFPLGVGICALREGPMGLYMGRIHTKRDTILDQTNVNILRSALTSLITCAVK